MATPELQKWLRQGRRYRVLGHSLFVREQGTGPVLLLLHGFPTSAWDWHQVLPQLAQHYRVIVPDMLGYGFSDKPLNADYSTGAQVKRLQALLDVMQVQNTHIMAFSYGASVVQEWLAQGAGSKHAILSVSFLNAGLFPDSNHPKLAQRLLLSPLGFCFAYGFSKRVLRKNLQDIFGPQTQPPSSLIDDYWYLILQQNGKRLLPQLIGYLKERRRHGQRWQAALQNSEIPLQLIAGDWDSISGIEVAEELTEKVPNAEIQLLQNIGHYPQLEVPNKVCMHYLQFRNNAL